MIAMIRIGIASESPAIVIGPSSSPPRARAVPSATPSRITGKAQITSSAQRITLSARPR